MKRYLYTGVLLGTIILAGCSANEETEEQVNKETTEGLTDGQTVEVEALSDTDKREVVVSVTPLDLTQEQKEDYHKQYFEIVEDLKAEYQFSDMTLVPLDEFLKVDWVEPEEFKGKLVDILEKGCISC
ncbi:hypothetical protein [Sporosarcina limicola]|uniref:Uncharacterized protein n=1 Tax=Sporosarcina limicola TaxID=34101 RepID=A0A927ML74_9BACL|nr:hypothetical protein [Sporosarcina limicola]MBE1553241.1 hypothetical protein [Sporosarcina limicola]